MDRAVADRKNRPLASLLENYQRSPSAFDEVLNANGEPRAQYARLLPALQELGRTDWQRRRDACERLVHEHGITDPEGRIEPVLGTRDFRLGRDVRVNYIAHFIRPGAQAS